jgi:hypothetical protein
VAVKVLQSTILKRKKVTDHQMMTMMVVFLDHLMRKHRRSPRKMNVGEVLGGDGQDYGE